MARRPDHVTEHRIVRLIPFPDGTETWECACGEQGLPLRPGSDLEVTDWRQHTKGRNND